MYDHEHSNNMEAIALRIILSCIEESHDSGVTTLQEAYAAARGCDQCWLELVKHLSACAAAGWESVDLKMLKTQAPLSAERREAVAAAIANELAAVLDRDE